MANLQDNIRLNTQIDLEGLQTLISKYKELGFSVSSVAAAARAAAEVQKSELRAIVAAEEAAEIRRQGNSDRRRQNKTANLKLETQAELDAIKIADAEDKSRTQSAIRNTQLRTAELRKEALETRNASQANTGLTNSLQILTGLRSQLIGLFGVMSVGSFAKEMVEAQSQVESFGLSMKNLLGADYGGKLVSDLKKFTVATPLNFEEVIKTTNQLVGSFKAAGASSRTIGTEIPQILESLGNSAAALGGENRLGRLVYAFSQVQATGRLMGTEVRQITETGFPLLAVMSQETGKSVQQLQADIHNGKVSFEDFKKAILSAGKEGGVFAGSMEIMANTVRGRIDKMQESVFFALANVGKSFNDSAKRAIDFSSSIVQALFGTESATKRTVDLLKTAISTWVAYTVATKIAASQTVINTVIDRASLLLRGQMALATISLTGTTESLTFAQMRAAAAARSLNTVMISNPLGMLALAIGAVVGAYQLYNSSVEQAEENQKKLSNDIATAIAPIARQKQEFDNLAKAVLSTNMPLSEQEKVLNKLKLQHPTLLKGIDDLSTSEDILNKNNIKTNSTLDFRNGKLEQLKKQYPEQLKGINTLADAELKLSGVVRATDRDFTILSATMENNIRIQSQVAGANENFAKKIQAQAELAKLRSGQTGANLVDFGGNIINNTPALVAAKEKEVAAYDKAAKEFVKSAEVIRAKNEELTAKLKYNWEEIPKTIEKTGKEGKEKALKYQKDTAKEQEVFDEIVYVKSLKKSRLHETAILDMEYYYDISKAKNAIGSEKQKQDKITELQQKWREKSAELNSRWDAEEEKDRLKSQEEALKDNLEMYKRLLKNAQDKMKDEQELNQKNFEEKKKLDEKYQKEVIKLEESKYELKDKLRILDRVSNAKNSKSMIDIENNEKEAVLQDRLDRFDKLFLLQKLHLARLKNTYGENSSQYKEQLVEMTKSQIDYNEVSIKLAEFRTEKVKDQIQKEGEIFKKILGSVTEVTGQLFDAIDKQTEDRLSKTTNSVEKNMLESIKADSKIAKDSLSAIVSFATGDIAGGITKSISLIIESVDNAINRTANHTKAVIEEQQKIIATYAETAKNNIESIVGKISNLSDIYKPVSQATISLDEQAKILNEYVNNLDKRGNTATDLINKELAYGQAVVNNYDASINKENDLYNKRKDDLKSIYDENVKQINLIYDAQIKAINDKYDYESVKANQKYSAETLGIVAAGTAQLEALIKNEESLASVRAEFAAKRLAIEQAFPLANKQITEGMSQAEVDAINASIKARDEAFAKLQEKYNTELVTIATAEGQKRKEYTDTEKIQNQIQENLDLAAIKFQGEEIQRIQDKTTAILDAEKERKAQLLLIEMTYDANLQIIELQHHDEIIRLQMEKEKLILESWQRLSIGIETELNRVSGLMSSINDKTSQAYKDLQTQLDLLIAKYKELTGNSPVITLSNNTSVPTSIPRGFEKGTDNTSISMSGQPRVDSKGGWAATIHPDEAIFSKADMTQMTRFMGKRPTRDEVIQRFAVGTKMIDSNSFIQKISPYVISKTQGGVTINMNELTNKIEKLTKEVVKRQQPLVQIDKNGIRTYMTNINSQIEIKNQKFAN